MPRRDGTGPTGQGSKTGRTQGNCVMDKPLRGQGRRSEGKAPGEGCPKPGRRGRRVVQSEQVLSGGRNRRGMGKRSSWIHVGM
jgi:hypothetical protein